MKIRIPTSTDIKNKIVLLRTDYNVPQNKNLRITDYKRIDDSINTINFLLKNNAKIIIISHLGRPYTREKKFSLKPIFNYLLNNKKLPISFAQNLAEIKFNKNKIVLLENIRFYREETKNDSAFSKKLSSLAEVFINDAFSVSHRKHASIMLSKYLPSFGGFSLEKEVNYLQNLLEKPKKPFIVIVGGAKISDKVSTISNLSKVADLILVGGAAANYFLKAENIETHKSVLEKNYISVAKKILKSNDRSQFFSKGYLPLSKIIFPIDAIAASNIDAETAKIITLSRDYLDTKNDLNLKYFDIGPKTIKLYEDLISQAKTIFWNGPMGVFEKPLFGDGTKKIARAIAKSSATSVVGGGDTVAAINKFRLSNGYSFVSGAGGAALEFLGGENLPGLEGIIG